jgi:hypothetical protein
VIGSVDGSGAGVSSFGSNVYSDSFYTGTGQPSLGPSLLHRYFPRESACDFRIRANIDSLVHNYTVQCVLPINLYNEQLFTLLWAWLWLVAIANCYDFAVWIYRLTPGSRYEYIRSRVRFRYSENSVKRSLNSFVYDYLSFDGVFVLRIMSLSMSDCVTHEIVQTLWQNFTETSKEKDNIKGEGGGGRGPGGGQQGGARGGNYTSRYSRSGQQHGGDDDR